MAAPVTFPGGNVYEIITTSSNVSDPAKQWRNVQAIFSDTGAPPAYGDEIINNWRDVLKHQQFSDSQIVSMELRAWQRGNIPFDAEGYIWKEEGINAAGDAATVYSFGTTHPADGDICMLIHKQQASAGGRVGKLYLHNNVRAEMLTMVVGGKPELTSPTYTGFPGLVTANFAATIDSGFFGGSANPGFITVHWSEKTAGTPFKRPITAFVALRVTEHQLGRHNG